MRQVPVDKWRGKQEDVPSRAEAIRRLIRLGINRDARGDSRETISFSDGEKFLLIMLRDLYEHLKITNGEIDPNFVAETL